MAFFLFVAGFIVLLFGAKFLIEGAASIGKKAGMSQLIVGLTVVALGTSLPELVINVFASFEGSTDLAIGNVVGSNITNTLLIVGIAAMIFPITMAGDAFRFDVVISLLAAVVLFFMANNTSFEGEPYLIDAVDGLILLGLFFLFLVFLFYKSKGQSDTDEESDIKILSKGRTAIYLLGGSLGLYFGGKWIVGGATQVALLLGVSESVIALTLVAGATSLPELVTSVMAAIKKNTDMAIGNAVGSNIFNIFLVLGVSSLITPIEYNPELNTQLWILIASGLVLILFIVLDVDRLFKKNLPKTKRAISSVEGILLVVGYILFVVVSVSRL
jgi:cation:H+ antiporter